MRKHRVSQKIIVRKKKSLKTCVANYSRDTQELPCNTKKKKIFLLGATGGTRSSSPFGVFGVFIIQCPGAEVIQPEPLLVPKVTIERKKKKKRVTRVAVNCVLEGAARKENVSNACRGGGVRRSHPVTS